MVEERRKISEEMLHAAHEYRKKMLEEYRNYILEKSETALQGSTKIIAEDEFETSVEEALEYEIKQFRKSPSFKNALHVVLTGKDFLSGLPDDVLSCLFTNLQKQLEDKEEISPRYSIKNQYMSALKTCVIIGKHMGRTKSSVLIDFADTTGFRAGDGMPVDELLRNRLRNYLKAK